MGGYFFFFKVAVLFLSFSLSVIPFFLSLGHMLLGFLHLLLFNFVVGNLLPSQFAYFLLPQKHKRFPMNVMFQEHNLPMVRKECECLGSDSFVSSRVLSTSHMSGPDLVNWGYAKEQSKNPTLHNFTSVVFLLQIPNLNLIMK